MHSLSQVPFALRAVPVILVMTLAQRLKQAREKAGYPTAKAAVDAMNGVKLFTYRQHENGTRGVPRDAAVRYARFFRVPVEWLLTGRGGEGPTTVPVVSYVGAGAEIYPIDDFPKGRGLEQVEAPPGAPECVAAWIKGDSMYPLRAGWLVFWAKHQEGVPDACIGMLCVVKVKDGPTLLKELRRGSKRGRYTLESWNAPPREDVAVEWASPIIDIRPR